MKENQMNCWRRYWEGQIRQLVQSLCRSDLNVDGVAWPSPLWSNVCLLSVCNLGNGGEENALPLIVGGALLTTYAQAIGYWELQEMWGYANMSHWSPFLPTMRTSLPKGFQCTRLQRPRQKSLPVDVYRTQGQIMTPKEISYAAGEKLWGWLA